MHDQVLYVGCADDWFHVTQRQPLFRNFRRSPVSAVPCTMDILHTQLATVQKHLAFVTTDAINWKGYVQAFSWGVTLFETYLLIRQYPLYSKTEPPAVLAAHFSPDADTFEKSQKYGKDKAKFSIFSGLYKQCIDSAMIQYGFYAWAWATADRILVKFGYGPEYEVSHLLHCCFIPNFVCRSSNPSCSALSCSSCRQSPLSRSLPIRHSY